MHNLFHVHSEIIKDINPNLCKQCECHKSLFFFSMYTKVTPSKSSQCQNNNQFLNLFKNKNVCDTTMENCEKHQQTFFPTFITVIKQHQHKKGSQKVMKTPTIKTIPDHISHDQKECIFCRGTEIFAMDSNLKETQNFCQTKCLILEICLKTGNIRDLLYAFSYLKKKR